MSRGLVALAVLVACSHRDRATPHDAPHAPVAVAEADIPDRPIEHRQTCGNVTAIFRGIQIDGKWDAYNELAFSVDGHTPISVTDDEDQRFETSSVFSPDCRNTLILRSRYGPYHVVATAHLAAYLAGGKPDHVLAGKPDPDGITGTGVFSDGAWISNTEVSYTWGCCDPPVVTHYKLDGTSTSSLGPSRAK